MGPVFVLVFDFVCLYEDWILVMSYVHVGIMTYEQRISNGYKKVLKALHDDCHPKYRGLLGRTYISLHCTFCIMSH